MSGAETKFTPKPDGIDVAIYAFIGARLNGRSIEEAERDAKAMLDFFGITKARGENPS